MRWSIPILASLALTLLVVVTHSQEPLAEGISKGTKTDNGLTFEVPFARGTGHLTLSRQNGYLRIDTKVWQPYSPESSGEISGSFLDVFLSVDGKSGRRLRFRPFPMQWLGKYQTKREECPFAEGAPPKPMTGSLSFGARGDVRHWDCWYATFFVNPAALSVAGNSSDSPADSWRIALRCGTNDLAVVAPEGFDAANPAATPDRTFTFKLGTLPERKSEGADPVPACNGRETALREVFKDLGALFERSETDAALEGLERANKAWPGELFVLEWRKKVALRQISDGKLKDARGSDYALDCVEACPSHFDWQLGLLDVLLGEKNNAQTQLEKLAGSALVRGDKALEQRLRFKWAMMLIQHGMIETAGQYLAGLFDVPGLKPGSPEFKDLQGAHWSYISLLFVHAKIGAARSHFNKLHASVFGAGWADASQWSDELANVGRYSEAAASLAPLEAEPEVQKSREHQWALREKRAELHRHACEFNEAISLLEALRDDCGDDKGRRKTLDGQRNDCVWAKSCYQKELVLRVEDFKKMNPRLEFETSKGRFVIELFEDDAPNTVANIVKLAKDCFYDGLEFYRWAPRLLIQGGGSENSGSELPDFRVKHESNERCYFPGALGMARTNEKDSGSSHFFIATGFTLDMLKWNGEYTVFGRVIEGMDVVYRLRGKDKMISVRATNLRDHEYTPQRLPGK